jgi:hypothetical protein
MSDELLTVEQAAEKTAAEYTHYPPDARRRETAGTKDWSSAMAHSARGIKQFVGQAMGNMPTAPKRD